MYSFLRTQQNEARMTATPKPGAKVKWDTPQGETYGTVEKVVTGTTKVKGHTAKASKEARGNGQERQVREEGGAQAEGAEEGLRRALPSPDAVRRAGDGRREILSAHLARA